MTRFLATGNMWAPCLCSTRDGPSGTPTCTVGDGGRGAVRAGLDIGGSRVQVGHVAGDVRALHGSGGVLGSGLDLVAGLGDRRLQLLAHVPDRVDGLVRVLLGGCVDVGTCGETRDNSTMSRSGHTLGVILEPVMVPTAHEFGYHTAHGFASHKDRRH